MDKMLEKLNRLYGTEGYSKKEADNSAKQLLKLQKIKAEDSKYRTPVVLTRCNKATIKEAIDLLPEDSRYNVNEILFSVTQLLENRYGEDDNGTKDYQLRRSGMQTTKMIKDKIELYLRKYGCRAVAH